MGLVSNTLLTRRRPTLLTRGVLGVSDDVRSWMMTKTSGGAATYDAGAVSVQTIAGDGYVEATASIASLARGIGFSTTDTNQNYTSIGFMWLMDGVTALYAVESGVIKYTGTYAVNDVLRVVRTGTTVTYLKNGAVMYTSLASSTGSLMVDTSCRHTNAVVYGIKLFDAGVQKPITWTNVVNVTMQEI